MTSVLETERSIFSNIKIKDSREVNKKGKLAATVVVIIYVIHEVSAEKTDYCPSPKDRFSVA